MAGQGCLVPPSTVLAGGALQTRVSSDLLEQSLDIPLVSRVGAVSSFHPIKGALVIGVLEVRQTTIHSHVSVLLFQLDKVFSCQGPNKWPRKWSQTPRKTLKASLQWWVRDGDLGE
ncbi:unnamed protein product [Clonostachys chloroleuca]|uniref:Uncharacterized protein n=1 Tax=Clonostachys chloroleuca TaxID=1926264 RepID=A0AA35LZ23_9HYPO|nr:unnamed protein product [Clonostachys chloroleuca]